MKFPRELIGHLINFNLISYQDTEMVRESMDDRR